MFVMCELHYRFRCNIYIALMELYVTTYTTHTTSKPHFETVNVLSYFKSKYMNYKNRFKKMKTNISVWRAFNVSQYSI